MNVLESFELKDQTAIVTGAARGLGLAMATGLAEAGANVIIPDINGEGARKAADAIAELGVETMPMEIDVTDEKQVKEMMARGRERFGRISILLNNAGITINEPVEEMSTEAWRDVIDLNLTGVFLCSREVGKHMIARGGGQIINVASMSAYIVNYPQPQAGYNASKAGVVHLTRSLAAEWAEHNIRVNAIAPGYMRTEMTKQFEDEPYVGKEWIEPTPMKRMGEPEELKGAVVYLASKASSFMTGHTLVIDGGYTVF